MSQSGQFERSLANKIVATDPLRAPPPSQSPAPRPGRNDARLNDFLGQLRACLPSARRTGEIVLAIAGVSPTDSALSPREKGDLLHVLQERLQRRGVRFVPIAQVRFLDQILSALQFRRSKGELERLLKKAGNADAFIRLSVRGVKPNWRVQMVGIPPDASCDVRASFNVRLETGRMLENLSQVLRAWANSVRVLAGQDNNIDTLYLRRFRFEKDGQTTCDDLLTDAFIAGLLRDANSALGLSAGRFGVQVLDVDQALPDGSFLLRPRFGQLAERAGLWIEFYVERDGVRVFQEPRRRVAMPDCQPRPRTWLDSVAREQNRNAAILQITAKPEFRVGDALEVKIAAFAPGTLHCWYLSNENKGMILTPVPGNLRGSEIAEREVKSFPRDWGIRPQHTQSASRDLFGCFLARKKLPEQVRVNWQKKWGEAGAGEGGWLTRTEVEELRRAMRSADGIVEDTAWIFVRD